MPKPAKNEKLSQRIMMRIIKAGIDAMLHLTMNQTIDQNGIFISVTTTSLDSDDSYEGDGETELFFRTMIRVFSGGVYESLIGFPPT